jgi:hypothetical protein
MLNWPLIAILVGALAAVGCLVGAFRALWSKRRMDDLPTSKTQGVFIGLTELKGSAESDDPRTSYLAGARCVWYSWYVEEQWSRTVTESYSDAQGRHQTRTRTETGWNRVGSGGEAPPFYLKDDAGVIRVVPDAAKIQSLTTFNETCSRNNPIYFGKGPAGEIMNTTHRRRFVETALPLHAKLYIMGPARERADIVAAEIAADKKGTPYLISTRTEKQLSAGYGRWFWGFAALGLALILAGAAVSGIMSNTPSGFIWPLVLAAVGFLLALLISWIWTIYNSLVNLHHRVEQGWSQVDVQLKRRHDLIPNLAQTVAGYKNYEKELQTLVIELRRQGEATPPGAPGPDYQGIAPRLAVVVEKYPELKANESFIRLQQSLTETEERIALARGYFNDAATFYNTRLAIIPDRYVAALAGFRPRALMGAADFERAPVIVKMME